MPPKRKQPSAAEWIELARRLDAAGLRAKAVRAYQHGLPKAPEALLDQLVRLQRSADTLGLESGFQKMLTLQPGNVEIRTRLGLLMVGASRLDEAQTLCAAAPEPAARLWGLRGVIAHARQAVEDAIESLQTAAALSPEDPWILSNLASALEAGSRNDDARAAAQRALAIEPANPLANTILSTLDRSRGDSAAAVSRLEAALAQAPVPRQRASMLRELGAVRDRLGDAAGAFSAFTAFNTLRRELDGHPPASLPAVLSAQQRAWQDLAAWPARPASDDGRTDPIFVVGFPRSGTSLTREMLDAHPGLRCTDEQTFLPALLTALPDDHPATIASLSAADIAVLRERYWASVEAVYPLSGQERLVDKLPLNLIHAGLIRRLFPAATLLVVLRDPRDCCLSAFMQDFRNNAAMSSFYGIADAARLYAAVFELWGTLQKLPGMAWHTIRYEDMVDDAEAAMRQALEASGLPWDDAVLQYARRAQDKHTRTPSRQDVQKPIFRRSLARWRRYEPHMAEALAILAPYVEAHGYR